MRRPAERPAAGALLGKRRPRPVVGVAAHLVERRAGVVDLLLRGALARHAVAQSLVVVVEAQAYRIAGKVPGIGREVPPRLGRGQELRGVRRQRKVAIDAKGRTGRAHPVRHRSGHHADPVLARQQVLGAKRVRERPVGPCRKGGRAVPRPDLHGGALDRAAGVVDYQAGHRGPLPLCQRRVGDIDRNHKVPQDGRVGRREGRRRGGCGEHDGHGGRKGGKRRPGGRRCGKSNHAPPLPAAALTGVVYLFQPAGQ